MDVSLTIHPHDYFFFKVPTCDNAAVMVWLGLGTKSLGQIQEKKKKDGRDVLMARQIFFFFF